MQSFTGAEYLMIDTANAYGLDKQPFQNRIDWVKDNVIRNIDNAESLAYDGICDEPILFVKGVKTIKQALQGKPVGHLIEFDATTSGPQIMSALTCCPKGGLITNLIDPANRYDCYSEIYNHMKLICSSVNGAYTRKQIKDTVMPAYYGSSFEPKTLFGDYTPELEAFYKTMHTLTPGAWELRDNLIDLWQPFALEHRWSLPDYFDARVKVINKKIFKIEVDELDHHKFNHMIEINEGMESYVSLAGNVIHSIDGLICRELRRRCKYDVIGLELGETIINDILLTRDKEYEVTTNFVSLRHLEDDLHKYDTCHLYKLLRLIKLCKRYKPFDVLTIHDA